MNRLLILSCSKRKIPGKGSLAAIDRYDGPAFRVLRKFLRENTLELPTVLIFSAKYGLIESQQQIPFYDCCLSASLALQLRDQVIEMARHIIESRQWHAVGVCAGKEYRSTLDGLSMLIPQGVQFNLLVGGLGARLTALRDWLHQSAGKKDSLCSSSPG